MHFENAKYVVVILCLTSITTIKTQKIRFDATLTADPTLDPSLVSSYTSSDQRYDPATSYYVSEKVLQLAQKIGNIIIEKDPDAKSHVFSPVSISAAINLLLLGSSGKTFKELMNVLGYSNNEILSRKPYRIHEELGLLLEDLVSNYQSTVRPRPHSHWKFTKPKYTLFKPSTEDSKPENFMPNHVEPDEHFINVANGIFLQKRFSIRPDYQKAVESVYKSELKNLNFNEDPTGSAQYINNWVNKNTNGRIKNIVGESLNTETKLIIASALYFKALWHTSFIEGATKSGNFFPDGINGRTIPVDFMAHGGEFPFYESDEYDCRIIGLPYKHLLSTMYIIKPNNSSRTKLKKLYSTLTADKIEYMISKMKYSSAIILFPKMHLTSSYDLRNILQNLGVSSLFSVGGSDLSLISTGSENNYQSVEEKPSVNVESYSGIQFPSSQSSNDQQSSTEDRLIFSKIAEANRKKRDLTYKSESTFKRNSQPLGLKDFVLKKRLIKENPTKKLLRLKRQSDNQSQCLKNLDKIRNEQILNNFSQNPRIYVDSIIHKVDLEINEKGTEGGAATAVTITRSGTQVLFRGETPFIFLIRHDATKLPIFYGTIFEPVN